MLSGTRHGSKVSDPTTCYPECNPTSSDLEKRSKGETSHQDNSIIIQIIMSNIPDKKYNLFYNLYQIPKVQISWVRASHNPTFQPTTITFSHLLK